MPQVQMEESAQRRASRLGTESGGGTLVLGILITILGLVALSSTVVTGLLSVMVLGAMLAGSGVVQIFYAVRNRHAAHAAVYLLSGVLSAVVGVMLMARTAVGLAAITLLLIGYFFASGLFRVVTALNDRYAQWGWDFVYGLMSIVLGVILIARWPVSSLWVVGTLVGIEIVFRGIALIAGGLSLMRWSKRAPLGS